MYENRKFTKYTALINKGINVTDFEAKKLYVERTEFVDFEYSVKKYSEINDSTVTVTDKEIEDYYEKHNEKYEQENSRDIAFVVIETIPSELDKQVIKEDMKKYDRPDFAELRVDSTQDEIINWVSANSQTPFSYAHLTLEELGDTALFYLHPDSIVGPIYENGSYVMKRVIDRVYLPDTVGAEHISIIPGYKNVANLDRAKEIADSLKTVIINGGDVKAIAEKHSADEFADKGGDMGKFAEGQYTRQISDACFYGKVGDVVVYNTQQGYHLVKVTYKAKEKKEKVRLAVVTIKVQPGNNTTSEYYAKARDFTISSENDLDKFDQLIEEGGYTKRIATDITHETKVIAGLDNAAQIINWANKDEVEKFSVSEPFTDGNMFVIAIITEKREKGIAPLEQIKNEIVTLVIKEKKGEMFANEMKNITSFEKSAKNLSFSSVRLNDDGLEFSVIATATVLGKNVVSEPVIGENGVYVLRVLSKTGLENLENIQVTNDKNNAQMMLNMRIARGAYEALKESSDIVDNRYKYF